MGKPLTFYHCLTNYRLPLFMMLNKTELMHSKNTAGRYERLFTQLQELLTKTTDPQARMATISALLYFKLDKMFWCGFYRLVDGQLIVGPYQGPVACQVLTPGKGVCWAGIKQGSTIIVPDVEKFPGHIACDPRSKSEIVIPVRDKNEQIVAVLDIDSKELDSFSQRDAENLERIVQLIFK